MKLPPTTLVAVVAGAAGASLGALGAAALLRRGPGPAAAPTDPGCALAAPRRPGWHPRTPARRPAHNAARRRAA
jgi:hypothetical protein